MFTAAAVVATINRPIADLLLLLTSHYVMMMAAIESAVTGQAPLTLLTREWKNQTSGKTICMSYIYLEVCCLVAFSRATMEKFAGVKHTYVDLGFARNESATKFTVGTVKPG